MKERDFNGGARRERGSVRLRAMWSEWDTGGFRHQGVVVDEKGVVEQLAKPERVKKKQFNSMRFGLFESSRLD